MADRVAPRSRNSTVGFSSAARASRLSSAVGAHGRHPRVRAWLKHHLGGCRPRPLEQLPVSPQIQHTRARVIAEFPASRPVILFLMATRAVWDFGGGD